MIPRTKAARLLQSASCQQESYSHEVTFVIVMRVGLRSRRYFFKNFCDATCSPACNTEIINFRNGAWDPITFRKHEILKVYVSDSSDKDVMVIGRMTFGHKNGQKVVEGYAGNFLFNDDGLIQKYQAWLVSDFNARQN